MARRATHCRGDVLIPLFLTVSPVEVENVLLTHPQVLDAAVVGVKDVKTNNELPRSVPLPFVAITREFARGVRPKHRLFA